MEERALKAGFFWGVKGAQWSQEDESAKHAEAGRKTCAGQAQLTLVFTLEASDRLFMALDQRSNSSTNEKINVVSCK